MTELQTQLGVCWIYCAQTHEQPMGDAPIAGQAEAQLEQFYLGPMVPIVPICLGPMVPIGTLLSSMFSRLLDFSSGQTRQASARCTAGCTVQLAAQLAAQLCSQLHFAM